MQRIQWWDPQSWKQRTSTFPNYFLFFGYFRSISVVSYNEPHPDNLTFAEDLWNETIQHGPFWPPNDEGSPFVPHLGAIKMKKAAWRKWINNVFQTVIWLGTSTPGKKSQERQMNGKGKGKAWGKGCGKGWHK